MSAHVNYAASLIDAITPELMRRIEIVAERRHLAPGEVILDFLAKGANTPQFLGAGVSTCAAHLPRTSTRRRAGKGEV